MILIYVDCFRLILFYGLLGTQIDTFISYQLFRKPCNKNSADAIFKGHRTTLYGTPRTIASIASKATQNRKTYFTDRQVTTKLHKFQLAKLDLKMLKTGNSTASGYDGILEIRQVLGNGSSVCSYHFDIWLSISKIPQDLKPAHFFLLILYRL